ATDTATVTATPTEIPTETPRPTLTVSATLSPTWTASPTASETPTETLTPSITPPPTSTIDPTFITWTPSPSPTPSDTPTATLTPTEGPSPTPTPAPTATPFIPQLDAAVSLAEATDFYPDTPGDPVSLPWMQTPVSLPAGTSVIVLSNLPPSATGIRWSYVQVTNPDGTLSKGWMVIPTPSSIPILTVSSNSAALRKGPSRIYDLVRSLQNNEQAEILGYYGSGNDIWYYVQVENSGSKGWVWSGAVETTVALETISLETDFPPEPTITPTVPVVPTEVTTTPEATPDAGA
ncbi:MAG: SH3 domain-containing protein, partial [Anaerolineae bacterium]|nr:SH3 domain-containing protein [Anaerolineae bacterium]